MRNNWTVWGKCSIEHFCNLNDERRRKGITRPLPVNCGEWTGVSSHDTKEAAEKWLEQNRANYTQFDKFQVSQN